MTLEPDEVADLVHAIGLAESDGAFTTARANRLRSFAYQTQRQPVRFLLEDTPAGVRLSVDGRPLPGTPLGALALWQTIDAHQRREAPPRADALWPEATSAIACATQALRRVVALLEPASPALARLARGVRTKGGFLMLPRDPSRDVQAVHVKNT